jgi:hypothetical protein
MMKSNTWALDRAKPGDGEPIAELLAQVLAPELNGLSVWGSPKLAQYIEDTLAGNADNAGREFFVLRSGERIGGVTCVRLLQSRVFVDNVDVLPDLRKMMLANRLVTHSIDTLAAQSGFDLVSFDAIAGNRRQTLWHKRMGASLESRSGWWLGLLPKTGTSQPDARIIGLEDSDSKHARWGFSAFEVETRAGRYKVGRPPGPYYRLTLPAVPEDEDLFSALRLVDPGRELFLAGPITIDRDGWERVAISERLVAQRDRMLGYLRSTLKFGKSEPESDGGYR